MSFSPCIKVCEIFEGKCIGCRRTIEDIIRWRDMTENDKNLWWENHPLFYAGIGSRKSPPFVLTQMKMAAKNLEEMGFILRSGGALGADTAFETGIHNKKENMQVFVTRPRNNAINFSSLSWEIQKKSLAIASQHHPVWEKLPSYTRTLMARNVLQILGADLENPVNFVLFWADPIYDKHGYIKDAKGGTGLAIRLAYSLNIPVFHMDHVQSLEMKKAIQEKNFIKVAKKSYDEAQCLINFKNKPRTAHP